MAKKKIVPVLNAAPTWKPDLSDYAILWHGCTALDKNGIEKAGIDLTMYAPDTDFGRGFCTTTLERQANQWAWDRFYDWQARHPGSTANQPVVLRFRVRRYSVKPRNSALDDGLDQLLSLHFVRGDYNNEDYWSLVQHCRQSTTAAPNDHRCPPNNSYQMVSGPVAAFWKQRVAMTDADQISFHKGGVDLLNALIDKGKGKGRGRSGDPDYYRWSPVT
jgi:hypothetical protein